MRLAALSVDLDEIPCYHAIYGLPAAEPATAHAVYERAVPRYLELFASLGAPCTFFAIGSDLAHDAATQALRSLRGAGHEIANHTQNHRYDLTRLSLAEISREVGDGADSIQRACGVAPRGFRAPGYTINDAVFGALRAHGVAYDSSVFPCPAYFALKTTAIAWIRARGRHSHSIVDTPGVLTAPSDPYRVGSPYWKRSDDRSALIELPIGVTRGLRLPYIGTTVMMAGPRGAEVLTAQMSGRPFVNLELHGTDVLGAREDGLEYLSTYSSDLRVSVDRKLETLRRVVTALRARGYEFVTLERAADAFRTA